MGTSPGSSSGPESGRRPCPGTPQQSRPPRPWPPGRRPMRLPGASIFLFRHHAERRGRSGRTHADPPLWHIPGMQRRSWKGTQKGLSVCGGLRAFCPGLHHYADWSQPSGGYLAACGSPLPRSARAVPVPDGERRRAPACVGTASCPVCVSSSGRGHGTPEVGYRIQSWSIRGLLLASRMKLPARRERRSAEPVFASGTHAAWLTAR